jgi:hypothetical protein
MKKECETLRRIEALPEPRHLFILPQWADPVVVDRLIQEGYLSCQHQQRDAKGALLLAMGLQITPKAVRMIHPGLNLQKLVFKGSLAGASFAVMGLLILYLG